MEVHKKIKRAMMSVYGVCNFLEGGARDLLSPSLKKEVLSIPCLHKFRQFPPIFFKVVLTALDDPFHSRQHSNLVFVWRSRCQGCSTLFTYVVCHLNLMNDCTKYVRFIFQLLYILIPVSYLADDLCDGYRQSQG